MTENTNQRQKRIIVIASPFIIIAINCLIAVIFGNFIGKWAFVPIILIEWLLFIGFVWKFGGIESVKSWLKLPKTGLVWTIISLICGLLPLPIFLKHFGLLASWEIFIPWILLAIINPWLEEFYWRGLLSDYTQEWGNTLSVIFTSFLFSANHAVFGINSKLLSGPEVLISTFIMGVIWAITFKKTKSLRWLVVAHFMVDFISLSVPSFLDLYSNSR